MIRAAIDIPASQVERFCKQHRIVRLSLFGSVLREDFGPDSDVDVLVEFESGYTPGLAFFTMQSELGDLLGREVELFTPPELAKYFKHVFDEAQLIYDAA